MLSSINSGVSTVSAWFTNISTQASQSFLGQKIKAVALPIFNYLSSLSTTTKVLATFGFTAIIAAGQIASTNRANAAAQAALGFSIAARDARIGTLNSEIATRDTTIADNVKQIAAQGTELTIARDAQALQKQILEGALQVKSRWFEERIAGQYRNVQQFTNDGELQAALLAATAEYATIYRNAAEALKQAKTRADAAIAQVDPALQAVAKARTDDLYTQLNSQLGALLQDVQAIALEKRGTILYHGNNRALARGAGANNTYYTVADQAALKAAIGSSESIIEAMSKSKGIIIQRAPNDGIGAIGGLTETTRRLFPSFNEAQFNQNEAAMRTHIEQVRAKHASDLATVAPFLKAQYNHVIATADLMLQYMADKTNEQVREKIQQQLDDLEFDDQGNVKINTNPLATALRASSREAEEEVGELEGLPALFHTLATAAVESNQKRALVGGNETLVDDNFLLTINGITNAGGPAQAVNPVVLGTPCSAESFADFETGLAPLANAKFVSPISNGELSGCQVLTLNELRRRGGVTQEGTPLSRFIESDRAITGKYAYRYEHERMGMVRVSLEQISQAAGDDANAVGRALVRLATEDQNAVFDADRKTHKLSLLASAQIMFKKDLMAAKAEGRSSEAQDALMYDLLAKELAVRHVNAAVLKAMDLAASEAWDIKRAN